MSSPDQKMEPRGPVAWMAGNSVAANLLMVVVLVGGLIMTRSIKQEVFPDMTADIVNVRVAYPGASPEEVEQGIVLAVEEAVQALDGIKEISSTASEGSASISIELLEGEDLQQLVEDVKGEIDQITTFPEDAEEPEVSEVSRRREVLSAIVYGDVPERTLHNLVEHLRDELLQDDNITQVDLGGVRPLEISVEVSQENLQRYGLTLSSVASQIRTSALDLPGGGVKTKGGEILVRVTERRDWGEEFRRLPLISPSTGGELELGELATIVDGYSDSDLWTEYNGMRAMELEVFRIGDQTPIGVADAVYAKVAELRPSLPEGVGIDVINDRSEIYKQRVELLLKNMSIGLVLVLIILGIFLEARLAFWVMMGIPISFMGALLIMPMMGVSLNMITLFAFIISLGIVVDDAIVIGEGVYYYRQQGMKALPAAIKGARELAMPVTFSILTNVVAFMPLFFVPGMMGRVFRMIPVVVISAFLVSLIESLFILPAHLGHQKRHERYGLSKKLHEMQQRFGDSFIRWVNTRFGPFLDSVLKRRYLALAVGLAVLILSLSFAASGRMGFSLFPRAESDFAIANITLPYGTAVERTADATHRLVEAAQTVRDASGHDELVEGIVADIGRSGAHTASVRVMLADPEIRDRIMSTAEFVSRWRKEIGEIPGVEELRLQSDFGGPGAGKALTVELSHRSVSVLESASQDLAEQLYNFPTVSDISDGFQEGKQQLDITLKPAARSLGLTASGVARQVRSAFYGSEVMRQQRGRNEVKVMVRLPEEDRSSEENINDLLLMTGSGVQVPMREVVDIHRDRAFTTITRRDGRRVIQVTGDVTPRSKTNEVISALVQEELPQLAQRYPGLIYSFEGRTAEQRDSMSALGRGFLFALLGIFALLAIPFRSYIQPLIVMTAIPFGIIGAVAGHLIMGYSLSVISMFGIVALSGVVVNDSLVLIDLANRKRREEGLSVHDAVLASATQRFRPILLTTLTTFLGLSPMILERAMQARFMIPMAISLGFGILFATFITLLLVPCLYMVSEDMTRHAFHTRNALRKLRGRPALSQSADLG